MNDDNDLDPTQGAPDIAPKAAQADLSDKLTFNEHGVVRGLKGATILFKEPVRPVYDIDGNPIGLEGGDVTEYQL